jgi:hypothetical protein
MTKKKKVKKKATKTKSKKPKTPRKRRQDDKSQNGTRGSRQRFLGKRERLASLDLVIGKAVAGEEISLRERASTSFVATFLWELQDVTDYIGKRKRVTVERLKERKLTKSDLLTDIEEGLIQIERAWGWGWKVRQSSKKPLVKMVSDALELLDAVSISLVSAIDTFDLRKKKEPIEAWYTVVAIAYERANEHRAALELLAGRINVECEDFIVTVEAKLEEGNIEDGTITLYPVADEKDLLAARGTVQGQIMNLSEFVHSADEKSVLAALFMKDELVTQASIVQATPISRRTVGKIVRRLREMGLTKNPPGNKGEGLTSEGKQFCRFLKL